MGWGAAIRGPPGLCNATRQPMPWLSRAKRVGSMGVSRIVFVFIPFGGVADDVLPYSIEFVFVSHYVLVVVALPHWRARRKAQPVDSFGAGGLKASNQGAERSGMPM